MRITPVAYNLHYAQASLPELLLLWNGLSTMLQQSVDGGCLSGQLSWKQLLRLGLEVSGPEFSSYPVAACLRLPPGQMYQIPVVSAELPTVDSGECILERWVDGNPCNPCSYTGASSDVQFLLAPLSKHTNLSNKGDRSRIYQGFICPVPLRYPSNL